MPGLIRGVARTAVIAGTATAVSNRVSRRQGNRWAQQQEESSDQYQDQSQQAPESEPIDPYAQLKELADLKSQGVLTDEEFQTEKTRILNS